MKNVTFAPPSDPDLIPTQALVKELFSLIVSQEVGTYQDLNRCIAKCKKQHKKWLSNEKLYELVEEYKCLNPAGYEIFKKVLSTV